MRTFSRRVTMYQCTVPCGFPGRHLSSTLRSNWRRIRLVRPDSSCVVAARSRGGLKQLLTVRLIARSTSLTYSGLRRCSPWGEERLGMYLLRRFAPPRQVFEGLSPQRILVGHGPGIFENASAALRTVLDGVRRRLPATLRSNGWEQFRALTAALGDKTAVM